MQNKTTFLGVTAHENMLSKHEGYLKAGNSEIEFWMPHTSRA